MFGQLGGLLARRTFLPCGSSLRSSRCTASLSRLSLVPQPSYSSSSSSSSVSLIDEELLRALPKPELHQHLDGSVRVATVLELAREYHIKMPAQNEADLKEHIRVPPDCPSLDEYLIHSFGLVGSVLQHPEALTRVTFEACEDAARDGVRYVELRFAPSLHTECGLSNARVLDAVCDGIALAEATLPITARVIVCALRHQPEKATELAELAWRYRLHGVVGFDLAGPEAGFGAARLEKAYDIVRSRGLSCTVHAGEADGWQSIQASIRNCGANRIGHAVALTQNEDLLRYVASRRIAIESCVTSNLQTKAVASLEQHPIRRFFEEGIHVVPCTDNTVISDTTLTAEYRLLNRELGFSIYELIKMMDYGHRAAFLPAIAKRRLRAESIVRSVELLSDADIDTSPITATNSYYDQLGVDFGRQHYWRGAALESGKPLPDSLLQALPKADLHHDLVGSLSKEFALDQFSRSFAHRHIDEARWDELRVHHSATLRAASLDLLCKPEVLSSAVLDSVRRAHVENVRYMEMELAPHLHCTDGVVLEDVVRTALEAVEEAKNQFGLECGLLLSADLARDSPVLFYRVAEACVKHHPSGVFGFAARGGDNAQAMSIRYFQDSFDLLKDHNIDVMFSTGAQDVATIRTALHQAGATRICGGTAAQESPKLMSYLAAHHIPVQVDSTTSMIPSAEVRLLREHHVPLVFGTGSEQLSVCGERSRSKRLRDIIQGLRLSPSDLLQTLMHGFYYNFCPSPVKRDQIATQARTDTIQLLAEHGIHDVYQKLWFPPKKQ